MEQNAVIYAGLSEEAQSAFEARWSPPGGATFPLIRRSGSALALIITLILSPDGVKVLAGGSVSVWIFKRIAVFVDAFLKKAGEDLYSALREFLSAFRNENPEAATNAGAISVGHAAAEQVEGVPINLVFELPLDEVKVSTHAPEALSREEAVLAYLLMSEAIGQSAQEIMRTRSTVFKEVSAHIVPEGYAIHWVEAPFNKMRQVFTPGGHPLSDPTKQADETPQEVATMRERLLQSLPPDLRSTAIQALERHDQQEPLEQ